MATVSQTYINYAIEMQTKYGCPASVMLGQFVYESAAGTSHLAQVANNCFGIKGTGPAGSYTSASGSKWRKYNSKYESFEDYAKLVTNSRYSKYTGNSKDPETFLKGLVKGGYCPDSGYVSAVMSIIRSYGFTKYDNSTTTSNSSSGSTASSAKDIVDVAISQIGYTESGNNRTKYGQYTGTNGLAWCQAFVSWCANQAGISTSIVPKTASTTTGMEWFKSRGLFKYKGSYTPKRGDIIYFKTGASHVGIVEYSSGGTVYTIEGNSSNAVRRRNYALTYKTITGYGVPQYPYIKSSNDSGTASGTSTTSSSGTKKTSAVELEYLKKILDGTATAAIDLRIDGTVTATGKLPEGKLTVVIQNGDTLFELPVKDGAKLVLERKCMPGKFTFEAKYEEDFPVEEGNSVLVYVDSVKIFFGWIFTRQTSKDGFYSYTAYDQLRYLKNKDTLVYTNKTADQLLKVIAQRFGLKCGTLASTSYVRSAVEDNTSLFDMIQNALDDTLLSKNKIYVLYDFIGELRLTDISDMKVNDCLIDDETGEDYTYKTTIDENVYNQIKLIYENSENGTYDEYIAKSTESINKWGLLQMLDKIDSPDIGKLKSEAYLKLYNKLQRTLKVTGVIGNPVVRAGSLVPVIFDLGDIKVSNYMLVDKVTHTFKNRQYTMDLNVSGGGFDAE